MCFRKSVASNVAWRMTKILESIDRPMSGTGSKLSWMTKDAQSLFGTLIKMKDRGRQRLDWTWAEQRAMGGSMFATLLVVGMSCWLAMFSLAEADPADQTAAPPLFDNLGSLHHPITTTSEQAQRYFDQGLRLVYAFNHEEAIRSFEAAAQQDPQAAMPYWGIALALGPNINSAMEKKDERLRRRDGPEGSATGQTTLLVGRRPTSKRWSHGTWAGRGPSEGDSMKPMRRPCDRWRSNSPKMMMQPRCLQKR